MSTPTPEVLDELENVLTVRTHDGRDITADTVLVDDDSLRLLGSGMDTEIDLDDVRSIIAGETVEATVQSAVATGDD